MGAGEENAAPAAEELPPLADTVEELHAAAVRQLAEFKAFDAQLKGRPLGLLDRERAARTLAGLTATLHKLQVMRCTPPLPASTKNDDSQYDDFPADIDAFREALARKIEAFMESRANEEDAFAVDDDGADTA